MTIRYLTLKAAIICFLGLLTGCASAPDLRSDQYAEAELNDTSFDLLFATEFPVASETEALARAAQAMQEGKVNKALFFYVRALQFQPENVELLAHIGEIHMQQNNFAMAKRAFLMARTYDPTHAQSLEALGLIYMSEDNDEQAVSELNLAVASNDLLWRAHSALGVYADKANDHTGAQQHYDAALLVNPNAAYVLNNRGYSKYLAGDLRGAALDFYEAANNQGFSQAWANLGRVYARQGWYDDAIETYAQVMSEANAYNNTGQAAIENGDFTEAKGFLLEAIRLSPTYFPAAEKNLMSLADHQ